MYSFNASETLYVFACVAVVCVLVIILLCLCTTKRFRLTAILFYVLLSAAVIGILFEIYGYVHQEAEDTYIVSSYTNQPTGSVGDFWQPSSDIEDSSPLASEGEIAHPQDAMKIISQEEALNLLDSIPMLDIDHAGLKTQNNDYSCWIQIPDSKINYPVLAPNNNTFYLTHNFNRQRASSGAIFIDSDICDNWPISKNLIIHGHNMKSGTMFAGLLSYQSQQYYNTHPFIFLYSPKGLRVYQVFAVYSISNQLDDNSLYPLTFHTDADVQAFTEMVKKRSFYDTGVNTPVRGRYLTLSTCTNHSSDRFILNAVLVREKDFE